MTSNWTKGPTFEQRQKDDKDAELNHAVFNIISTMFDAVDIQHPDPKRLGHQAGSLCRLNSTIMIAALGSLVGEVGDVESGDTQIEAAFAQMQFNMLITHVLVLTEIPHVHKMIDMSDLIDALCNVSSQVAAASKNPGLIADIKKGNEALKAEYQKNKFGTNG